MRAEYYADQYRRYATYLRDLGGNQLYKIACGPTSDDYHWTEVLMREVSRQRVRPGAAHPFMAGLALHYYTRLRNPELSESATQFGEAEWFALLKRGLFIEELVDKHATIMDKYDPEKRVGLIVDEWGAWYQVEPGTNPGFLYQQNSLRDALLAGVTLNIFNQRCDRVKMANIAQTINVLQAMVLTQEDDLVLTPTYHVFEMYKHHQDATLLPIDLQCGTYEYGTKEPESIPVLSASASRDRDGRIHLSVCNLHPNEEAELSCVIRGAKPSTVTGRVLTADLINAHNTFEQPEVMRPVPFEGARLNGSIADGCKLSVQLPAKSVVLLALT
jgi:alpha-N-arabinofuranosidase